MMEAPKNIPSSSKAGLRKGSMLLHWLAVKPTMQTTSSSAILSTVVSAFREGRATNQPNSKCGGVQHAQANTTGALAPPHARTAFGTGNSGL